MPRIEVYKGNGSMIPVETAKKGKAFICPWTKKMYAKKQDYIKHLKNLRETRMHKRAREIVRNRVKQDLWKQSSFDDIIKWFNLHPEFLFQRMLSHQWHDRQKYYEKYRETFMMEITHLDLHWSDRCSNTHSCPHNGVTNWDGREVLKDGSPAPRGYPGWVGNIEFKVNCDMREGSNVLKELSIHTGSGGCRGENIYGYSVTFVADDWPELFKDHKHQMAEDQIQDKKDVVYKYNYGKAVYFKW